MGVVWQNFSVIAFILCYDEYIEKNRANAKMSAGLGSMEGRTYIVGREGHIYIGDLSVSRQHAEIKFINGRIRLRDLSSTNGIFLVKDNRAVRFQEGFVKPLQPILIGKQRCTVHSLLAILGILAD